MSASEPRPEEQLDQAAHPKEVRGLTLLGLRLLAWLPLATIVIVWFALPELRESLKVALRHLLNGDVNALEEWARGFGAWALFATLLLMVAQAIAAPIPAVFVTWTNSLLFGPFLGGLWSIFSATLAACFCFGLARTFGAPLVRRFLSKKTLARSNAFLSEHGANAILGARLLPLVPFDPISYLAGLSQLRLWPFFWATLVGQIPAGMAYSYLGRNIAQPARLGILFACTFLSLLVLGWVLRRVLLKRKPH